MNITYRESLSYDDIFGEPSTEVWKIHDLLDFMDDVISFTDKQKFNVDAYTKGQEYDIYESINDSYNLLVDRVVATTSFKRAVKELHKKHKTQVLKELKEIIIKLGNYEITTQKSNHPLKGTKGHVDLHLSGGDLVLLYKYDSESVMTIAVDETSLNKLLRLQDIVNHTQLNNYDVRRYKDVAKDFSLDDI